MFDLIVVGGGPAGYHAAEYAVGRGLSVLCAEQDALGGECLNRGCIPTKTLLAFGKAVEHARFLAGRGGLKGGPMELDHLGVVTYKDQVVQTLTDGVRTTLGSKGVRLVQGHASAEQTGGGYRVTVDGTAWESKNLLLAIGSEPIVPPVPGLDQCMAQGRAVTSAGLLSDTGPWERLLIVGAGVIGLEFGSYFASLGRKVSMVEAQDQMGGDLDADVEQFLRRQLRQMRIDLHLSSRLVRVEGGQAVVVSAKGEQRLPFDRLLLCVGRRPCVLEGLDLTTDRGAVVTDGCGRTSLPGCYAAGDMNGRDMLAHVAYREAEAAVNCILGREVPVDYSTVPRVIYLQPEVAAVGLSERGAAALGLDYEVKEQSINYSGRHMAENGPSAGFCKLIIDREKDVLLGAVLCAAYASEIVFSLSLMIQCRIPLEDVRRVMFPHPTVCEIVKETLALNG